MLSPQGAFEGAIRGYTGLPRLRPGQSQRRYGLEQSTRVAALATRSTLTIPATGAGPQRFEPMPDLQAYVARVLHRQDKVLMEEASSCLRTGARRAAYITLWLAVAESVRRKFFEAQTFDGEAGRIVGEIQRREAAHKALDGRLIVWAKDYGFVSDNEATRLQHVYENRNVFGHPYEQSPSDEAVLAAAADAVEIVLERPTLLRHGYLDRQVSRLTTDLAFLSDDLQAVERHAELVRGRSARELQVWFIRKLVATLGGVFADPSNDLLQRRGVWFLRSMLRADPSLLDDWDVAEDLPDHPTVIPRLLAVSDLFGLISSHAKDIVVNVLCLAADGDPRDLAVVWTLKEAEVLETRHVKSLTGAIAGMPIGRLSGSGLPLLAYRERVVDGLASHSWDQQNEATRVLRAAGPGEVAGLSDPVQEELGRNVMQAAEGSAFGAQNFLGELTRAVPPWPAPFLEGIAVEPFLAVDGALRLKPNQMRRALRVLHSVEEPRRGDIIARIRDGLAGGPVRDHFWFGHQRAEALQSLESLATEEGLERLSEVRDALEAVVVQDLD